VRELADLILRTAQGDTTSPTTADHEIGSEQPWQFQLAE
jgi:hypothetical protein